jgi:predicted DsbA family dithiol-disulfide isomerase
MTTTLQIDFISDVACPWCAIGLASFERALAELGDEVRVDLRFQPFELNPTMGPEGADAADYLIAKYGMPREQLAVNRRRIVERGAAVGFSFGERKHVWNTFDAHRLLYWAGVEGPALRAQGRPQREDAPSGGCERGEFGGRSPQHALKKALLQAYHGEGRNPGAHDVLAELAAAAGLDAVRAREVLASNQFSDEVREAERFWQEAGIDGVPAVVINRRHLVQGGQPPEVFVQALRQVASASEA